MHAGRNDRNNGPVRKRGDLMSFTINIQQNKSDVRALTKDVRLISALTGTMRAESSVIDPVILISGDMSSIAGANYMSITEFKRSYFITNIETIRNGVLQITGHVDVLSTYASQIRANRGVIRRQENLWNLYLDDGSFKVYNNPIVLTKAFPSGFTSPSFILAVSGS